MGIWSDLLEIGQICGKLIRFVGNWPDLREPGQICSKDQTGKNWSDLFGTGQICGDWSDL